jgi:hypothetical protein
MWSYEMWYFLSSSTTMLLWSILIFCLFYFLVFASLKFFLRFSATRLLTRTKNIIAWPHLIGCVMSKWLFRREFFVQDVEVVVFQRVVYCPQWNLYSCTPCVGVQQKTRICNINIPTGVALQMQQRNLNQQGNISMIVSKLLLT